LSNPKAETGIIFPVAADGIGWPDDGNHGMEDGNEKLE